MAEGFVFGRAGLINGLKWAEVVALHGSDYLGGEDVFAEGSVGHDGRVYHERLNCVQLGVCFANVQANGTGRRGDGPYGWRMEVIAKGRLTSSRGRFKISSLIYHINHMSHVCSH